MNNLYTIKETNEKELISEDKQQINKFIKKISFLKDNKKIEHIFLIAFAILITYDIFSIKNDYFKIKQKGGFVMGAVSAYSQYSMMKGPSDPNKKKLIHKIKYIGYITCFFVFIIAAGLSFTILLLLIIITFNYANKNISDLIRTLE